MSRFFFLKMLHRENNEVVVKGWAGTTSWNSRNNTQMRLGAILLRLRISKIELAELSTI